MKPILVLLFTLCLTVLQAADPSGKFTYKGEVAGVMCAICSGIVKTAISKIPGVESVKVLHGETDGAPAKLVVVSSSDHLTKEDAIKALGDEAKSYTILSLARSSE